MLQRTELWRKFENEITRQKAIMGVVFGWEGKGELCQCSRQHGDTVCVKASYNSNFQSGELMRKGVKTLGGKVDELRALQLEEFQTRREWRNLLSRSYGEAQMSKSLWKES
jgi:hypothetical protein